MSDAIARLARSDDWVERVRAAHIIAWSDVAAREETVLGLLRDPGSAAVREAMVASLLEARREGAIPLILRALGQSGGDATAEAAQCLLEGLLDSELDGLDVRGTIISVLLESDARDELLGVLAAINWLVPGGGFPAPPRALARVTRLARDKDEAMRKAARDALPALGSSWQQPDLET
jgi:hypothetical protein